MKSVGSMCRKANECVRVHVAQRLPARSQENARFPTGFRPIFLWPDLVRLTTLALQLRRGLAHAAAEKPIDFTGTNAGISRHFQMRSTTVSVWPGFVHWKGLL